MVECSFCISLFLCANLKRCETMREVIAIANQKGGVGKIMTSVSLSWYYVKKKYQILENKKSPDKIKTNGVNLVSWLFFIFLEIKECLFYL